MDFQPRHALTSRSTGRLRALITSIQISLPTAEEGKILNINQAKEYKGVWDTGATNSVITKRVVDELGLKPIGLVEVHHAGGKSTANKYLVNIILPNRVAIQSVTVTEGALIETDMLIGMDIITLGDFAVTNKDGKTVMSFRIPSCEEIDFIPESDRYNSIMQNCSRKDRERFLGKNAS